MELFTSQGCSSCPPADALLNKLSEMPGVLTLSFSVDYWDYLGWHDTLGSPANSERQRDYARARGDGRVYTPQAVVDGLLHINGADERLVLDAIDAAKVRLRDVRVPVEARAEGDTLVIDIGDAQENSHSRDATVWLAIAKEKETVPISRGENRGRTITYRHPVREISPVGMWKGAGDVAAPAAEGSEDDGRRLSGRVVAGRQRRSDPWRRRIRAGIGRGAEAARPCQSLQDKVVGTERVDAVDLRARKIKNGPLAGP